MPPVVCIVGRPKVGKTTLIAALIQVLRKRGYRVATIKHTTHDFEMDTPGTDSWKHAQAGSECVVLSSGKKLALFRDVDHDFSPMEISNLITDDFDIVLAEGFKRSGEPKIEVHHREIGDLVCKDENLMAVVSDDDLSLDVPLYSRDKIEEIAGLIEGKLITRKTGR